MEDSERKFEGVWIDKEIWLDKRLSALEKVIYVEIRSLDNEKHGHCTAGNEYLAEFCGCSIRKITDAVSKLLELGYIKKLGFDGKVRTLCVADSQKLLGRIEKTARQNRKKCVADSQKVPTNNIYNNINNNISNNSCSSNGREYTEIWKSLTTADIEELNEIYYNADDLITEVANDVKRKHKIVKDNVKNYIIGYADNVNWFTNKDYDLIRGEI